MIHSVPPGHDLEVLPEEDRVLAGMRISSRNSVDEKEEGHRISNLISATFSVVEWDNVKKGELPRVRNPLALGKQNRKNHRSMS